MMKVSELIEALSKMPPDCDVFHVSDDDDSYACLLAPDDVSLGFVEPGSRRTPSIVSGRMVDAPVFRVSSAGQQVVLFR